MKVGDIVVYKGLAVGWTGEYGDYLPSPRLDHKRNLTPGIVVALHCNCPPEEERWWLEGGCQCVADVLWAGDPVVQGHVVEYLAVLNEAR